MQVRKAVITAAGLGTRFLPITKSQPKEMLPLVNKPLIQYAVEEIIGSGIREIIIVIAPGKGAIRDYFCRSSNLEEILLKKGQTELVGEIRELSNLPGICCVMQRRQLGLGHAILTAREVIGDEPFAVVLPDDIVDSDVFTLKRMIEAFKEYRTCIIAVERIDRQDTIKYGVIRSERVSDHLYRVLDLVEKPEPDQAPSNLGIVGRYILTPQIFAALEATPPGKNREIQLTDALKLLLQKQPIYACELEGGAL